MNERKREEVINRNDLKEDKMQHTKRNLVVEDRFTNRGGNVVSPCH